MAFGPGTPLVQQALLTLLQGRNPSPMAPVPTPVPIAPTGGIGPLNLETTAALAALQPEPVPPALPGPVDADAIRARFAGLAGPEPVAPPEQPNPLILRIARALQGFGAGVQGQGPQFLAQLREQRERPMREFEAKKERFETRRQELGVMGEQAVLSAEDRRQARTLELLDRQAERDFQRAVKQSGVKDQRAVEQMRHAFDLERDAKKAEFERLEQERKDAKERKVQIANLANILTDDFKISRQQARRFAEFELNDVPLSAADAKAYSRIEKYRRPVGAAGGTGSPMVEVVDPQGNVVLGPLPYGKVKFDNGLVAGFPGASIRRASGQAQPQYPAPTGMGPSGIPLAPDYLPQSQQAAPKLTNQQRARFNDIKRNQPEYSDAQILDFMKQRGWLK